MHQVKYKLIKSRLLKSKLIKSRSMIRNLIQAGWGIFLLYIGWKFFRFVRYFEIPGAAGYTSRPPAVEGFLPISALVSLKSWLGGGGFDRIHPAGFAIFLGIILISLLFKKGFCSWFCPIGALSEALGRLGARLFGKNHGLPKFLDYPLMAVKYLILGFFIKVILVDMSPLVAQSFQQSAYNKIADVKMLKFFLEIGQSAVAILLALALFSLVVRNFWCRYLCPYGALLGIVAVFSPWKVTREAQKCTGCNLCNKACPNRINVAESRRVWSAECSSCLDCLEACPAEALEYKGPGGRFAVDPRFYPVLLFGIYLLVVLVAQLTGHWQSSLTLADYRELIPQSTWVGH